MAVELPHPDKVRALLTDSKYGAADLVKHGDAFLAGGRASIAVMFFEKAKSKDGLAKIREYALKEGDEFLLTAVSRNQEVVPHDWQVCAEAAMAKGRFSFARDAFKKAGDEERSKAANEQFLRIGR